MQLEGLVHNVHVPCLGSVLQCGGKGDGNDIHRSGHSTRGQEHIQLIVHEQGVVTPIGAILKAATGDTTKSPGHGGFSRSQSHKGFQDSSKRSQGQNQAASSVMRAILFILFTLWSRGHMQF